MKAREAQRACHMEELKHLKSQLEIEQAKKHPQSLVDINLDS